METFSASLALCEGNPLVSATVDSPHKDQCRGTLMFSLICARTSGSVNNRDAGDLRRYRLHCDVTVMITLASHERLYNASHFTRPLSVFVQKIGVATKTISKFCITGW